MAMYSTPWQLVGFGQHMYTRVVCREQNSKIRWRTLSVPAHNALC